MQQRKRLFVLSLILGITLSIVSGSFMFNHSITKTDLCVDTSGDVVRLVTGNFNSSAVSSGDDAMQVLQELCTTYGYENAEDELVFDKALDAAYGKVYKFKQVKNGYAVYARGLNVSVSKNGNVLSISGNYLKNIDIPLLPDLTADDAITLITAKYNDIYIDVYSVALEVYSLNDTQPCLAYDIVTNINGGARIFVNAVTGDIIQEIPLGESATNNFQQYQSTQTDFYGNTQNVTLERIPVGISQYDYYLGDATRNIFVQDCNNTTTNATTYSSTNGKFTEKLAITAYLNVVKSFDFYADSNNIGVSFRGLDGSLNNIHNDAEANDELTLYVGMHYDVNYQNASYSTGKGFGRYGYILIGDGNINGNLYNIPTALDVIAHEYQHGVTDYNAGTGAGLVYLNGSGAINEAVSDIFGAIIEGYELTDDRFWIIAENATQQTNGLRSMKNPAAYRAGYWYPPYPAHTDNQVAYCYNTSSNHDHYSQCDYGGVHSNSNIITHAAYKMYEKMPQFFTKQAMGTLWYSTLCMLPSDASFSDLLSLMRQAALNLGYGKSVVNTINSAFGEVGIFAADTEYTINFNQGNLTGSVPESVTGVYGDEFTVQSGSLSGNGVTLIGWREAEGSKIYYIGETYQMSPYNMTLYPVTLINICSGLSLSELPGDGTVLNPYLISNAQDLATLAYYVNNRTVLQNPLPNSHLGTAVLTADIDLSDLAWVPIGTDDSPFTMRFDGTYHVIKNLNIAFSDGNLFGSQGLFGSVGESPTTFIKNLGIESGQIDTYADYAGGIAGRTINAELESCYSKVTIINKRSSGRTGGIVGFARQGTNIIDCINTGNVKGGSWTDGITGAKAVDAITTNCINIGTVTRGSEKFYDVSNLDFTDLGNLLNTEYFQISLEFACHVYLVINGEHPPEYTVTFLNADGSTLSQQNVLQSQSANAPSSPNLAPTAQYSYIFSGWDTDYDSVYSDLTITAVYNSVLQPYAVTFINWDGTLCDERILDYGDSITPPEDPAKPDGDYTFAGWYTDEARTQKLKSTNTVSGNMTLYAKWDKNSACGCGTISFIDTLPLVLLFITCAALFLSKKRKIKTI